MLRGIPNMNAEAAALYISIAGIVVSIVGWFVVHWSTDRMQQRNLVNSLRNEARISITNAIHDYHECCVDIIVCATSASVDEILAQAGVVAPHIRRSRSLRESCIDSRTHIWLRRLEEFECLFSETATARVELLYRNQHALAQMIGFADQYEQQQVSPPSSGMDAIVDEFWDLVSLTWDLLIHVQNRSIGEITGHTVPPRKPIRGEHPILTTNPSGQLVITQSR
jgi:hypothetical protein